MDNYEEVLIPIKNKFNEGKITDQEAIALLLEKLKESSKEKTSENYQKFKKLSKLLFKDESSLNLAYNMPRGNIYKFSKASEHYNGILFSLYTQLSDKDFNNEEELLLIMKNILQNKRILELGCGVGFNLKVLDNLGAKTSGTDIIPEFLGKVSGIDLKIGDSENLQKIFCSGSFDIVYSMDFFTDTILNHEKSKAILKRIFNVLKPQGLVINHITYKQVPIPVTLLSIWLYCQKNGGDYNLAKEEYFKNNPELGHSNEPSLTKEDYKSHGFEVLKYCEENEEFVVIARKN